MRPDEDDLFPHYFSTYCMHEYHSACWLTCKVCEARCQCECHADFVEMTPAGGDV